MTALIGEGIPELPRQLPDRDGQPRLEGKTLLFPPGSLQALCRLCAFGRLRSTRSLEPHHWSSGPSFARQSVFERVFPVPRSRCMAPLIPPLGAIKQTQATTSSRPTSRRRAQVATCHHPMGTPSPTQTTAMQPAAAAGSRSWTTTCRRSCQPRCPASPLLWLLGTQSCTSRVRPERRGPPHTSVHQLCSAVKAAPDVCGLEWGPAVAMQSPTCRHMACRARWAAATCPAVRCTSPKMRLSDSFAGRQWCPQCRARRHDSFALIITMTSMRSHLRLLDILMGSSRRVVVLCALYLTSGLTPSGVMQRSVTIG